MFCTLNEKSITQATTQYCWEIDKEHDDDDEDDDDDNGDWAIEKL